MPDPIQALQELIDPRLAGDYPIESVLKVSDAVKPTPQSVLVQEYYEPWNVNFFAFLCIR